MKFIFPYFRMDAANGGNEGGAGSGTENTQTPDELAKSQQKITELEAALATSKKASEQATSKLSALTADIQKIREQGLKSKEDYKTLSESLEGKVNELTQERDKLKDSIFHTSRVSAVKEAALKLGLRHAALQDIEGMDLEEVKVTVGEDRMIRTEGADAMANKLKTLKAYMFETPKDPNLNLGGGNGGGGGGTQITQADLVKAYNLRNKGPAEAQAYRDVQKKFAEQASKAKAGAKK